jgi:hypothetical protein
LAALWPRIVADLACTAPAQHVEQWHGRILLWWQSLGARRFVAALAMSLLVAALLTPVDPLSMLIVGLPLYGIYLCAHLTAASAPRVRAGAMLGATLNVALWIGLAAGASCLARQVGSLHLVLAGFAVFPLCTTAAIVGCAALAARRWGRASHGSQSGRPPTIH